MFLNRQSHARQQSQRVIVRLSRTFNVATHRIRLATHRLIEMPAGGCQLRLYPFDSVMVCVQVGTPADTVNGPYA